MLLGEGNGPVGLEIVPAAKRALLIEMVADGGLNAGGFFKVWDGAEPLDLPLNFHPAATGARLVFTPFGAG